MFGHDVKRNRLNLRQPIAAREANALCQQRSSAPQPQIYRSDANALLSINVYSRYNNYTEPSRLFEESHFRLGNSLR